DRDLADPPGAGLPVGDAAGLRRHPPRRREGERVALDPLVVVLFRGVARRGLGFQVDPHRFLLTLMSQQYDPVRGVQPPSFGMRATMRIDAVSSSICNHGRSQATAWYDPGFPGISLTSTRASASG